MIDIAHLRLGGPTPRNSAHFLRSAKKSGTRLAHRLEFSRHGAPGTNLGRPAGDQKRKSKIHHNTGGDRYPNATDDEVQWELAVLDSSNESSGAPAPSYSRPGLALFAIRE
jgi:hypothetical protein